MSINKTEISILVVFLMTMATAAYFDNKRANTTGLSKICLMDTCIVSNK